MDNHSKKIKISFSVIILLLIAGIVGGSFAMKDNNFFITKQLAQTINYLNYKSSFAYANDKNLTAAIISIFNNASPTIENNNNAKSIPVLLYHSIINEPDGANVLLENFKDQMFALKRAGWRTVSIEDFYQFMKGEKNLLDKSFLLTFDDGAKSSYYPVDPILKALDYNAVTFIITKYSVGDRSGSNYYLSNSELERMVKSSRWDAQSHGREGHNFYPIDDKDSQGHFFGNKLWFQNNQIIETEEEFRSRIYSDFVNSKNDLENEFGINVVSFAYPFGDFGQNSINFPEAKNIVLDTVKSVYPMSFYQVWGGNPKTNYPQPDAEHLFIKRVEVKPQWSADDLLTVLEKSRDKNLSHQDDLMKDNGWQKDWGNMDFKDSSMVIGANASTTGGAVFLDGTYLWQNYIFKAKIDWIKGDSVSLIARFKDDKNYISCSFNGKKVRIEQYLNSKKRIIAEKEISFEITKENLELGVAVNKDKVDCFINGDLAVYSYYLSPVLSKGGIGFKTWDSQANNSELIVKNVSVKEIKNGENLVFPLISDKYKKEKLPQDKKQNTDVISVVKKEIKSINNLALVLSAAKPVDEIKKTEIATLISLPYFIKEFNNAVGFKNLWGDYFIKDNLLHITSNASTTSGFTILESSGEWTDYLFNAKADLIKGTSFSLVARYKDAKNYVSCSFSNYGKSVNIYQVLNGETKTLGRSGVLPVPFFTPWLNLDFSVKASGDNIECLINNEWVLKDKIETMPKSGGIGFKIWGDKSYNNEVMIKEINAEKIY